MTGQATSRSAASPISPQRSPFPRVRTGWVAHGEKKAGESGDHFMAPLPLTCLCPVKGLPNTNTSNHRANIVFWT